jgi:hypothetical protein
LKVVRPGLGIRTGLDVYYTVGGEKYVASYPASIANCPQGMTDDQCQSAYLKVAEKWKRSEPSLALLAGHPGCSEDSAG